MKNYIPTNGLILYLALLCIWLAVCCAAFFFTDINTAMAGTLILSAVAVASLSLGSGVLVFSVNLFTIIVYGVMINILYSIHPSSILIFITFSTAVIGTGFLAWNTSKLIQLVTRKVERDHLLIDEMRIKDEKTGLMRFHYARRVLSTEVSRSLRFGKTLVVLLIKIDNWEELAENIGLNNREALIIEVSEILFNNCRNIDTLFLNIDKIGVILPETDIEGGKLFARRVAEQIKRRTKRQVHIGIAGFPEDSITDDDLLRKCDIALRDALENDRGIANFSESFNSMESMPEGEHPGVGESTGEQLTVLFVETDKTKKLLEGELAIYVKGSQTLQEIEALQMAFEKIKEFQSVRLVDFEDNKVVFAIQSESEEIPELLLTRLDIPNIAIEEKSGVITINLNPSTSL